MKIVSKLNFKGIVEFERLRYLLICVLMAIGKINEKPLLTRIVNKTLPWLKSRIRI
jgi:hypothetical protein